MSELDQYIEQYIQNLPIRDLIQNYISFPYSEQKIEVPQNIQLQIQQLIDKTVELRSYVDKTYIQYCNGEAGKVSRFQQHNHNKQIATTPSLNSTTVQQQVQKSTNIPIVAYDSLSYNVSYNLSKLPNFDDISPFQITKRSKMQVSPDGQITKQKIPQLDCSDLQRQVFVSSPLTWKKRPASPHPLHDDLAVNDLSRDPATNIKAFTYSQLKKSLIQLNKRYSTREAAIQLLQEEHAKSQFIPRITLTSYQKTSPSTVAGLETKLINWLQDSDWFNLIVQFVPVDARVLHQQISQDFKVSAQFLDEFLLRNGVLTCYQTDTKGGQLQVKEGGKQKVGKFKQLTLSEMLKRK